MVSEPVQRILDSLKEVRRTGDSWMARCPAHDDTTPSLSIAQGDDGRCLLNCFAGCSTEQIVASMGRSMSDLFVNAPTLQGANPLHGVKNREVSASTCQHSLSGAYLTAAEGIQALEEKYGPRSFDWTYHDASGQAVGAVVRWDRSDGTKFIQPLMRDLNMWRVGGMTAPRPLYRLLEVVDEDSVFIVEGEKAADAALVMGLNVTTSAHGSKSVHKTDWTPLAGKTCVILPDNDKAGEEYADSVIEILQDLKPPPSIRVVRLPDLPPSGDLVEFLSAHNGDIEETISHLNSLLEATVHIEVGEDDEDLSLPSSLTEYEPFPVDELPHPIDSFVHAAAHEIGCAPAYIALPLLAALASAIGTTRVLQVRKHWYEPAILWTAIIGESGTAKSPAIELAVRPVRDRQHDAMKRGRENEKTYQQQLLIHERALRQWKASTRADPGPPPEEPTEPVTIRRWCDDTTVEGMTALLAKQPRGLIMIRDELSGWIGGFGRYANNKADAEIARWLEWFHARPSHTDRKTSDALCLPCPAVSITGGIQPGILKRKLTQDHLENGLAARMLMAWPPRRAMQWQDGDVPDELENAVKEIFSLFYSLQSERDEHGDPVPTQAFLEPAALDMFINFYNEHGQQGLLLEGAAASAWTKLRAYALRFALIIHTIRWAANDPDATNSLRIDSQSVAAAIRLVDWFGRESERVYDMLLETDEQHETRDLFATIRRLGGTVTARDLQRASRRYPTSESARSALDELANDGLGCWETHKRANGRISKQFVMHV